MKSNGETFGSFLWILTLREMYMAIDLMRSYSAAETGSINGAMTKFFR